MSKYFTVLAEAVALVEERNGHPLQGDEIMNIDETGLCLSTNEIVRSTPGHSFTYGNENFSNHGVDYFIRY